MTKTVLFLAIGGVLAILGCNGEVAKISGNGEKPMVQRASAASTQKAKKRVGALNPERKEELLSRPTPEVGSVSEQTDEHYESILTAEEFRILRRAGTERAFSGVYDGEQPKGIYRCRACNAPLYESDTKYESGTGWPSFYEAIEGRVELQPDNSHGMRRTELICAHCKSHLGHVFDDGPQPTGKRHCINSVSMVLEEE